MIKKISYPLMHSVLVACLSILIPLKSQSQNFLYKAKVDPVNKTGFYSIQLTPQLAGRSDPGFADLRMFDNDGKEIPYLLKKEEPFQLENNFIEYPILKSTSDAEWQEIIVENTNQQQINQLIFQMKNADADRYVRISGSSDQDKWFVVRDSFNFSAFGNEEGSLQYKAITFPAVDYAFFKIEIKNKNNNPLNILKAGYSNVVGQQALYLDVPGLTFTRKDSNKKTYLYFTCIPANRIDKLVFNIKSPALFHRTATFRKEIKEYFERSGSGIRMSKASKRAPEVSVEDFILSAEEKKEIQTPQFLGYEKTDYFTIEIENQDNEALQFESIKPFQLVTTIVSELKKDKTYFVYTGDSLLSLPMYDLIYFSSKLSDSIQTIHIQQVLPKSQKTEEEYSNKNDKYLVWIGLGIVGIVLFLLTGNMLKKMGKDESGMQD